MSFQPADFLWLAMREKSAAPGETGWFDDEVMTVLRHHWSIISLAYAGLDRGEKLLPARGQPGYLVALYGNWRVFVPWPLVKSFPDAEVIEDVLNIGASVSIPPVDNLCVSGSSAALGSSIEIGDLDFCQYVTITPAVILGAIRTFTAPSERRILVRVKYGDVLAQAPWPSSLDTLSAAISTMTLDDAERLMIEFMGMSKRFGVMPISTVVLASDFEDRTRGAARFSFVYQEAVAVPAGATVPPWSLVDPSQVGKYVNFLRDQIECYATERPLKALKRALALAHTIRLHDFVPEALEILLSREAGTYVKSGRSRELEQQLSCCSVEERNLLRPYFDDSSTLDDVQLSKSLYRRCQGYLKRLKEELERLDAQLTEEARVSNA